MITNAFDNKSKAIIEVAKEDQRVKLDACILTFSYVIIDYVLKNYLCKQIGELKSTNGIKPVYKFLSDGYSFGVCMVSVGAPVCVGDIEVLQGFIDTKEYVLFGGAGCLDKEIVRGKIIIPTKAYRDEGTSYHYAPSTDYINIKTSKVVAFYMQEAGLNYIEGKTWTTDAFFRETRDNFNKRKEDGCISVEMECAAVQAMCDFRGLNVYVFFTSADLLDSPEWNERKTKNQIKKTQHDAIQFEIALGLAKYVVKK